MSNRENRRHPKHPLLPNLTTSKKRVVDDTRKNFKSSISSKLNKKNTNGKKQ